MMNAVLTAGMLTAELLHVGASVTDYPLGSFWPDEKTLPMESCVAEFSFKMETLTLIPPAKGQKTSIVSLNTVGGEFLIRARRQIGCVYDCKMKVAGETMMPVTCSKVGNI